MRGLSIRNLTKKYNGEISALNDVSFEVESGEIVGLIGSNGAGKSTTIKVCTRLLQGFSGEVCLGGEDIRSMPLRNYPVSYIPDEPVCFEFMTVGEHLEFAAGLSKNRGFMDADDLIDRLEMGKHLDKTPNQLSKGTKQKLMIAIALLRDFELLIADEPFTGLDPRQISVLRELFSSVKASGRGVLLSTHLIGLVDSYCDRFAFLDNGRIVGFGTKEELAYSAMLGRDASTEDIFLRLSQGG